MTPPVKAFPAWKLDTQLQELPNGKMRKEKVDLKSCELLEMVQYNCDLVGSKTNPKSKVVCEPIVRLFRR